jgi:hypothetical protein
LVWPGRHLSTQSSFSLADPSIPISYIISIGARVRACWHRTPGLVVTMSSKKGAIIGASTVLVVAVVAAVCVVSFKNNTSGKGGDGELSASVKSIKSFCQPVDYRETCESALERVGPCQGPLQGHLGPDRAGGAQRPQARPAHVWRAQRLQGAAGLRHRRPRTRQ